MKAQLKFFLLLFLFPLSVFAQSGIVVLQTDFGVKDSAVSEIKGVMYSVDKSLVVADLTQQIPPFNIWEAAYRLLQAESYWPKGSVFVSVVDPGVGTSRKSVVALSKDGRYFVTPDNGTLTFIAENVGITEVREIDQSKNRLQGSGASYTFFGRDVYGYTAAKLASGKISFEQVGPVLNSPLVMFKYQAAEIKNHQLSGTVIVLDPNFGNVWTNISQKLAQEWGMIVGKSYYVVIYKGKEKKFEETLPLQNTFGAVKKGAPLLYFNSLLNLSIALDQGNFAQQHHIQSGPDWRIVVKA